MSIHILFTILFIYYNIDNKLLYFKVIVEVRRKELYKMTRFAKQPTTPNKRNFPVLKVIIRVIIVLVVLSVIFSICYAYYSLLGENKELEEQLNAEIAVCNEQIETINSQTETINELSDKLTTLDSKLSELEQKINTIQNSTLLIN
jgi:predicted PurR-regulated permease PerM